VLFKLYAWQCLYVNSFNFKDPSLAIHSASPKPSKNTCFSSLIICATAFEKGGHVSTTSAILF
jgi:hypothetical protein